ncbi:hypothetical protein KEJ36_04760 [Candidatus Bathyarchaeota archaeon]|nr:hypothetical protein [Candidatus Bathyarchaeota archaeon]MBS7628098.1 hypothetical protein [Candidatus Bathyarchaeota archaeon]
MGETHINPIGRLFLCLRRFYARMALLLIALACLIMLLFPFKAGTLIGQGTYWDFRYTERVFMRNVLVREYKALWHYRVVNSTGTVAIVTMESDYRIGYSLPDGSWIYDHGKEMTSFILDMKTRQYLGSIGYSSWWIPSETRAEDIVPIWSSFLRVKGSAPRLLLFEAPFPPFKLLLDCWVLDFESDLETLTLYYEKTTGFFIYFQFHYYPSPDTVVSGERSLINTNLHWPIFSLLQPFLMPLFMGALALLLASLLHGIVRRIPLHSIRLEKDGASGMAIITMIFKASKRTKSKKPFKSEV